MEQFPDGGFFKGKNFVFDHRYALYNCPYSVHLLSSQKKFVVLAEFVISSQCLGKRTLTMVIL